MGGVFVNTIESKKSYCRASNKASRPSAHLIATVASPLEPDHLDVCTQPLLTMPPSMSPAPAPSRAPLMSWWKHWILVQKMKAREPQYDGKCTLAHWPRLLRACVLHRTVLKGTSFETGKVFGIPLRESLRTASVQISTANQDGYACIQHGSDN
jgi:hypothetical protein